MVSSDFQSDELEEAEGESDTEDPLICDIECPHSSADVVLQVNLHYSSSL
jgi:hypothetical protein